MVAVGGNFMRVTTLFVKETLLRACSSEVEEFPRTNHHASSFNWKNKERMLERTSFLWAIFDDEDEGVKISNKLRLLSHYNTCQTHWVYLWETRGKSSWWFSTIGVGSLQTNIERRPNIPSLNLEFDLNSREML